MTRKYDPKAGAEVEKAMHEHRHKGRFKNDRQAVAIGLSKAREKGLHVPKKKDNEENS